MSAALSSLKCFARETKYLCTEIHLHDHLTKRILQQCLLYFISLRHNLYPKCLVTSHVKGFTYKTIHESVLEKIIYNYMCRNNFILPCKSIYNFNFDLKVMRDQPRTEQLIKRFFWCQWDAVHQRLYYLHYVKRGEGERARIAPSVSCVQFYQNSQHDNIVSTA